MKNNTEVVRIYKILRGINPLLSAVKAFKLAKDMDYFNDYYFTKYPLGKALIKTENNLLISY